MNGIKKITVAKKVKVMIELYGYKKR